MTDKDEFLTRELMNLSWAASVQRANIYAKNTEHSTTEFRDNIISFIKTIIPLYEKNCIEEQHYANIELLISHANSINRGILGVHGYKYGVAQKVLNLALKYFWCLDRISPPPHCPVDRIIINMIPEFKDKINWTDITDRSDYEKIIEKIKTLAENENLSIPEWEIKIYNSSHKRLINPSNHNSAIGQHR